MRLDRPHTFDLTAAWLAKETLEDDTCEVAAGISPRTPGAAEPEEVAPPRDAAPPRGKITSATPRHRR